MTEKLWMGIGSAAVVKIMRSYHWEKSYKKEGNGRPELKGGVGHLSD